MNTQKGFAPIVIIIVVVALLAVGAGWFVLVSKSKTSSQKAVVSTDTKLLEGLWKIETAYEWVNPPGNWRESEELKADIPYQEFRNGMLCSEWPLRIFEPLTGRPTLAQALDKKYCGEYKPFRTLTNDDSYKPKDKELNALTFAGEQYGAVYEWKIVDGKLQFGTSGGRGIYVKIAGTRDLATEPKDVAKPNITSFTASSLSVGVGDEITFTCTATDASPILITFDIVGLIAGGSTEGHSGGQFKLSGESNSYTFKIAYAGSYTATCKVADQAENETKSVIKFSAK